MFASMVKNKIAKSKINIDNAYNSQIPQPPRKPEPAPQALKKTQSQTINSQTTLNTTPQPTNKQKSVKNEIELKSVLYNTKKYEKPDIYLRFKEDGSIDVDFSDEHGKVKLEIKKPDIEKRIDFKREENCICLNCKKLTEKKEDPKNRSLVNEKILKEQTVFAFPRDKDVINKIKNVYSDQQQPTNPNKPPPETKQPNGNTGDDGEDQYDVVKFVMPNPSRLAETQKLRRTIKDMKEEDKNTILMDIFKIKKEYEDSSGINRKLKCPIHTCQKQYRDVQQLKTHLKTKHPELGRHGIELTEYDGSFDYSNKALDLALFLGKEYPTEMKKIIKKMKTKVQPTD